MASKSSSDSNQKSDVKRFIDNLWFFLLYFLILLTIASFGLIAEA